MDNNKVPLILFSGGLDSSYLLQEKLKKGSVDVLYVRGTLHEDKMKEEEKRREIIISLLEKRTGNVVRTRTSVDLGDAPFGSIADIKFCQPLMWLNGATIVSDSRLHTELCIGYVCGDSVNFELGHVTNAWNSLQSITKHHGGIPLNFPLAYTTKEDILQNLDPEVLLNIWYCEHPITVKKIGPWQEDLSHVKNLSKPRPCGECIPCITMAASLYKWRKINKVFYWKSLLYRLRVRKCTGEEDSQAKARSSESENVTESDLIEIMDKHDGRPASSNS